MAKKKEDSIQQVSGSPVVEVKVVEKTEKEKLLELHKTLKDYGFNSIGDIEVRISKL